MAVCQSTIAAEALHFRVRDGNGCFLLAMITGKIGPGREASGNKNRDGESELNTPEDKLKKK